MKRTSDLGPRASGWRPPTRRAFVAMLALAAVRLPKEKPTPKPKPIWIGHR